MTAAPVRQVSARLRVNVCAALGLVVGAIGARFGPWQLAVMIGWIVVASSLLGWIWAGIGRCDAAATRQRSTAEDSSRTMAVLVMVIASVVSIGGVVVGIAKSRDVGFGLEIALVVASLLAVVLSWCVVHTMFAVHYAHQYYREPVGGIVLPGGAAPDYRDFAYMAFTVGMSFATSDVEITSAVTRRIVLRHALVSYVFGAAIVGLTINVMANFI